MDQPYLFFLFLMFWVHIGLVKREASLGLQQWQRKLQKLLRNHEFLHYFCHQLWFFDFGVLVEPVQWCWLL